VPNPNRNVGGLAAMVAAAGEYYDRPNISVADVTAPKFQAWLKELMGAVTDFSSLGSYSAENLALFGYSMGDGGQLLESDLLTHMAGILTRWADPLEIVYPKYVTWFDFPFTVWMGTETTAQEKNAALEFEKYLLTPDVQQKAVSKGLRPANVDVGVDGPDSLFVKWKDQGAVAVVPRTSAMRSPDREVLQALLRWFELNVSAR
jgi:ABC-type Fe3+ transport system substrate-binding protein